MYTSPAYTGYSTRDQTATLFGQTMGLVALTAALFALGAYAGRHLSEGAGDRRLDRRVHRADGDELRRQEVGRASAIGLLVGVRGPAGGGGGADAGVLVRIDRPADPVAVGRGDRAVHRRVRGDRVHDAAGPVGDPRGLSFFALIALLDLRDRADLHSHPHGSLIYAILGLVIFAALTMGDFQRLRRSKDSRRPR